MKRIKATAVILAVSMAMTGAVPFAGTALASTEEAAFDSMYETEAAEMDAQAVPEEIGAEEPAAADAEAEAYTVADVEADADAEVVSDAEAIDPTADDWEDDFPVAAGEIVCPEGWDSEDPGWYKEYLRQTEGAEMEVDFSDLQGDVSAMATVTTSWMLSDGKTTFYHDAEDVKNASIVPTIDISKWQGEIDFNAVRKAGIEAVFIRAAYRTLNSGELNTDERFTENIRKATAAGLKVGVYLYSQAITTEEAKNEANYVLKLLRGGTKDTNYYKIELPVVFDPEYGGGSGRLYQKAYSMSRSERQAFMLKLAKAFCSTVESAGFEAMVYSSSTWFVSEVDGSAIAKAGYPIWLARYNITPYNDAKDNYFNDRDAVVCWQCSPYAKVDGISGTADLDWWYQPNNWVSLNIGVDPDRIPMPDEVEGFERLAGNVSAVKLGWDAAEGVDGYRLYYSDCRKGPYESVDLSPSKTAYIVRNLKEGREYYFKIRSYVLDEDGKRVYGIQSGVLPAVTCNAKCYVKVSGADYLNIRSGPGVEYGIKGRLPVGKYALCLALSKNSEGVTWYKVKYGTKTGYISSLYSELQLKTVEGLEQGGRTQDKIRLNWKKSPYAQTYRIYRATGKNSTYRQIADVSADRLTFLDKGLTAGRTYYYKVRAIRKTGGKTILGKTSAAVKMSTKK